MTTAVLEATERTAHDKIREVYGLIENSGLFIAPERDVVFGIEKTVPLNVNGTELLQLPSEGYNSGLLFTILAALIDSTMIFYGPPGAGKTTVAEYTGHLLFNLSLDDIHRATIYGHPEQTQEMMVARYGLAELMTGEEKVLVRKFMQSRLKMLDEVNRNPPGKLSILYQVIDRGFTEYGDEVVHAEKGPLYMTANAGDSGNYPLPAPFLDRVGVAVVASHLNPCYFSVFDKRPSLESLVLPSRITEKDLSAAREEIMSVDFSGVERYQLVHFLSEVNYCFKAGVDLTRKSKGHALFKKPGTGLCADCHYFPGKKSDGDTEKRRGSGLNICHMTVEGISPRSYRAIANFARAVAWWRGKDKVSVEDLEAVVPYCIWHKLTPTDTAYASNPLFVNDRIAFAGSLFAAAKRSYGALNQVYSDYDKILESASRVLGGDDSKRVALRSEIEKHLEALKGVDSPAKYPIAVTLAELHYSLR